MWKMGLAFSHCAAKVAPQTSCPAPQPLQKLARDDVVQFVDPTINAPSTQAALACSAPDMLPNAGDRFT